MKSPRLPTFDSRLKLFDTRKLKPPPKVTENFYGSAEWKAARAATLKRDKYTCVVPGCGRREGRMFVDHIKERKDGGADFDLENLQTLCGSHHTSKTIAERVKRGNDSLGMA
jgi:5-methylcytosine-specific restriction protein A